MVDSDRAGAEVHDVETQEVELEAGSEASGDAFEDVHEDVSALEAEAEIGELLAEAVIGALLLAATKPMSLEQMAEALRVDQPEAEAALKKFRDSLTDEAHGFAVHEIAGGYQLRTSPRAAKAIARIAPSKFRRLSKAAAETLAIIAYKQSAQKSEIEALRGVDVLPTLKTLLETKLIRIVGYEDAVGRPALYGTTETFLEKFGLKDLAELPSLKDLRRLANDPGESESDERETGEDSEESEHRNEIFESSESETAGGESTSV